MTTTENRFAGLQFERLPHPVNQSCSLSAIWNVPLITGSGLKHEAIYQLEGSNQRMVWLHCTECGVGYPRQLKEHRRAARRRADPYKPQKTYCSDFCARGRKPIHVKKTCPECGGRKASHAKTCTACYATAIAVPKVSLECRGCGALFERPQADYKKAVRRHGKDTQAYCSKGCYDEYRHQHKRVTPQIKGECATCGKGISTAKRQKFCSRECYWESRKKTAVPGYTAYQGEWLKVRTEILHRDMLCRRCMKFGATEVHHIDHDAANHVPSNLIGLCRECHAWYHGSPESVRETWKTVFKALATVS